MVDTNGQGQSTRRPSDMPRGLGRGLSALIPDTTAGAEQAALGTVHEAPVDSITPNPEQPRTAFDDDALEDLTASVREHGVIQPLLVTQLPVEPGVGEPRYQLIAGERRLRAAQAAGLERVPVTVRESVPREQLVLALIENVQREDLNPLEESRAYKRLVEDYGLTQQQVAERVGRSRAAVTNRLRLLELSPQAQQALAGGAISARGNENRYRFRATRSPRPTKIDTSAWTASPGRLRRAQRKASILGNGTVRCYLAHAILRASRPLAGRKTSGL